ncbi:MAG: LysR family transcriptional regulator [Faecalibacterium sp. CAG:82-related_59_9]|nr:MAG: LysR family transcriptional regulator [Faecalibacterium sp. CAG:82-related_59_9]
MTLFSYEIFDAVARQGSFNKAAQQLHLTPSAISHAIAVMEAELGFTLFNRGKNGVTMTSYGASLYPSIRGLEKGKVKLGAFNSVCAGLLPQILKSFMASYPQIEVEVYQGTYDDVKEWLRTGQVDLAFLSATCREEFNLTELFREPLLCIVPQDWPEPPNGIMTPELMNGQSFVVQCDATDAEMRQFLKKYSISTERRCHVIDDQSNIAMVEAGLGISIMPRMLLRSCTAAVKIYPIEPEEYRVVGLAVQRPTAMAPAVEQMFRHIVDFCRQMDPQLL